MGRVKGLVLLFFLKAHVTREVWKDVWLSIIIIVLEYVLQSQNQNSQEL